MNYSNLTEQNSYNEYEFDLKKKIAKFLLLFLHQLKFLIYRQQHN